MELQLHKRGWKKILTDENLAAIRKLIEDQNDITIDEIREKHLTASYSTIERAIWSMGFRLKKSLSMQASVTVIDVEEKRENWAESSKKFCD